MRLKMLKTSEEVMLFQIGKLSLKVGHHLFRNRRSKTTALRGLQPGSRRPKKCGSVKVDVKATMISFVHVVFEGSIATGFDTGEKTLINEGVIYDVFTIIPSGKRAGRITMKMMDAVH